MLHSAATGFTQRNPRWFVPVPALALATRADRIPRAILIGAEKRSAAMDAFLHAGFAGIERVGWTLRIPGDGSGRRQLRVIVGAIPVAHPLPDVPAHVIEPVPVRRELCDRRDARERIRTGVVIGEVALMRIRHPVAVLLEFIAPGEHLAAQAAARRKLPFRFGRQTLAGPLRVSKRVFVRHMHHRKPFLPLDRALWTERMTPAGAVDVRPPLKVVVQRHRVVGRREDHRTGSQVLRRRGGEIFLPRLPFGDRDVIGRLDESGELLVGHFGGIHPEAVHVGAMHRPGVRGRLHPDGVIHVGRVLRAHRELAAGNPHHAGGRRPGRGILVFDSRKKRRCRHHLFRPRTRLARRRARLVRHRPRAHRLGGKENQGGDDHDGDNPCPRVP